MSVHRIARQSVDLRVGSEREAQELHAELSARLLDRLSPALAEVFDEACPDAVTIRIAALEIDAGVVPREDLVDEVVARIREQLAALLEAPESIGAVARDPLAEPPVTSGIERLTDEDVALEIVEAFLRRGALPWRHAGTSRQDVEARIEFLIERAPAALARLLRSLPIEIAARVWLQVSPPVRSRVLTVLGARRPDKIERLVFEWSVVLDAAGRTSPKPGHGLSRGSGGHAAGDADGGSASPAVLPAGEPQRGPALVVKDAVVQLFAEAWRALVEQTTTPIADRVTRQAIELAVAAGRRPESAAVTAQVLHALQGVADRELPFDSPVRAAIRERHTHAARITRADTSVRPGSSEADAVSTHEVSPVEGAWSTDPSAAIPAPAVASRPKATPIPWRIDAEVDAIWTPHAGLVIAWPFLQGLFTAVGLVVDQGFVDDEARARAVLLAAHLADGEVSWGEHELVMEKLVCGCPVEVPVAASIEPTDRERAEAVEVLRSILTHWTALKSTSIEGLRQAFLRRPGTARSITSGWKVDIPRAGHDLLLDKLPWGIGLVKLPWMEQPLSVEW